MRTALSVLLTCWPPAPPARMRSHSMSESLTSTCTSSGSGKHRHRGRRGVNASLRFRLGHALDAMAAAFVAQLLEDFVAGDAEDDFLVAPLLAGAEGDFLDLPTLVARILHVHAIKVAGEDRRLVAARAGADFHDDAAVVLAFGKQQIFEPVVQRLLARPKRLQLFLDEAAHLRIGIRRAASGPGRCRRLACGIRRRA